MSLNQGIISKEPNLSLLDSYDLFICSAGFEDRSLAGIEKISDVTKFKKTIINLFRPSEPELYESNKQNLEKIQNIISKICDNQSVFEHRPTDHFLFDQLLESHLQDAKSILIDTTSFTRLFLYSILNVCVQNNIKTHILYSEPAAYTMNFAQGLEDIIIMPTNPGIPDQSKKILMILFLGWESRRIGSVVEEWEPDKLITIAEYSDDEQREQWNGITIRQCYDLIEKSDFFRVPTLRPKETLANLEQIYERYNNEYDICLVNGGPKIQCLAFSEFALRHPEVQILYPKPYQWKQKLPEGDKTFPASQGKGRTYLFSYPVNPIFENPLKTN